jgi:hypothetical protein
MSKAVINQKYIGAGAFRINTLTTTDADANESGGNVILHLKAGAKNVTGRTLFKGKVTNGANPKTATFSEVTGEISAADIQSAILATDNHEYTITIPDHLTGADLDGTFFVLHSTSVPLVCWFNSATAGTTTIPAGAQDIVDNYSGVALEIGTFIDGDDAGQCATDLATDLSAFADSAALALDQGWDGGEDAEVEITTVVCDTFANHANAEYFTFYVRDSGGAEHSFYLWVDKDGAAVDPAPTGITNGIEASLVGDITAADVAVSIQTALAADTTLAPLAGASDDGANVFITRRHEGDDVTASTVSATFTISDADALDSASKCIIKTSVVGSPAPVIGNAGQFVFDKRALARIAGIAGYEGEEPQSGNRNFRAVGRDPGNALDLEMHLTYQSSLANGNTQSKPASIKLPRYFDLEWVGGKVSGGDGADITCDVNLEASGIGAASNLGSGHIVWHSGVASLEIDGDATSLFQVDPAAATNALASEASGDASRFIGMRMAVNKGDTVFNSGYVNGAGSTLPIYPFDIHAKSIDPTKFIVRLFNTRTGTQLNTTNEPVQHQTVELIAGGTLHAVKGQRDNMSDPQKVVAANVSGNVIARFEKSRLQTEVGTDIFQERVPLTLDRKDLRGGYHYLRTTLETSSYKIIDITQVWLGVF